MVTSFSRRGIAGLRSLNYLRADGVPDSDAWRYFLIASTDPLLPLASLVLEGDPSAAACDVSNEQTRKRVCDDDDTEASTCQGAGLEKRMCVYNEGSCVHHQANIVDCLVYSKHHGDLDQHHDL